MLFLAANSLDKLNQVPRQVWISLAVAIGVLIAAIVIIRKASGMNKIWLCIVISVVVVITGFQWIYERNEPKFMSPVVEKIAPFFPAKVDYKKNQQKPAPR